MRQEERGVVTVHKLILKGVPDDGERLEEFCRRLAPSNRETGAGVRALAVELARREELEVSAVAYDDESFELEVVFSADPFREAVTIDRDRTGEHCQVSWERWADIRDDAEIVRTVGMVAAIVSACAASR
jgi:hypothetical protein